MRDDLMLIPGSRKLGPVTIDTITHLEGAGNYTIFHFTNRPQALSSVTLKRFEGQLPGFLRISKRHLVNPEYVTQVVGSQKGWQVTLTTGKQLAGSRRRLKVARELVK